MKWYGTSADYTWNLKLIMRKTFVTLLLMMLPGLLLGQSKQNPPLKPFVLTHVTVIEATGAPAKPGMTVVIVGDRITEIGKSGSVRVPKDARVTDATGKFLIPGLWDMHAHLSGMDTSLQLCIANGVTGARDMGGDLDLLHQWQKQIELGAIVGPRIVAAGLILDGPTPGFPLRITVKDAAQARQAVDSLKKRGVDFIKVHFHLSREAYFAIADEAKKQGLSFAGHVPISVTAAEASDAGQKSIEHLNESLFLIDCSSREAELRKGEGGQQQYLDTYNEEKCQALFARFRRNGTWQVPTLVTLRSFAYMDEHDPARDAIMKYAPKFKEFMESFADTFFKSRTREDWTIAKKVYEKDLELVGAMHRAGVGILAGTDVAMPGFDLHDELVLLVRAGLTPMEALQAATLNPAKFLGKLHDQGTVEKGKLADLVLLDANPLRDINNTKRINAVVVGGRFIAKSELQEMLAKIEAAANKN